MKQPRLLMVLFVLALPLPVWALINPNFTPADLAKGSPVIVEMQFSDDGQVRDVKALKGDAPKDLRFTVDESVRESLPGGRHPALLFLVNLAAAGETTEAAPPVGAVHVNNAWFGMYARDGGYTLAADTRDLKTVWAGGTAMLASAIRSTLADPARATFPAKVGVQWRGETGVAKPGQPVAGLQAVELSPTAPPWLHVLSTAGDYLWSPTARRALPAKSERACWSDLNGDGRLDLVSWDGKTVGAWLQEADGNFAGLDGRVELPDVTGLVALRGAVAAGGKEGVVVLALKEKALAIRQTLRLPEAVGGPGPIVAGDFDNDGTMDLVQVCDQGLVAWPGLGAGRVVWRGRVGKAVAALDAGDFDADGLLDLLVGGRLGEGDDGGANLLANTGQWTFMPAWYQAGEVYKVQTRVRAVQSCDINGDGKFDFLLAYERSGPVFLFNRGFRTFGTCDELTLAGAEQAPEAGAVLDTGAPFGVVADFDGDGAQDGAFAAADGNVWVIWRQRGPACQGLLLAAPPGAGPVQVTVAEGQTLFGALLAAPGRPAYCGFPAKGGMKLTWTGSDGKPRTRTVPVIKALTRVELED
jgi:hypothetical protein